MPAHRVATPITDHGPDPTAGLLRDENGVRTDASERLDAIAGGGGAPLPDGVRTRFEQSLGADLGGVRVHTDDASAAAADAVGARAFARGNDIHFGAGQYQPDDPFGLHLLAHEVSHTVQQSGGATTTQYKLAVSSPGDAAEAEADRAADAMVAGHAATVSGASDAFALHRSPKYDAEPEYSKKYSQDFDAALDALNTMLIEQVQAVNELAAKVKDAKVDVPLTTTLLHDGLRAALTYGLSKAGEAVSAAVEARTKSPTVAALVKKAIDAGVDAGKDKIKEIQPEDPKKGAQAYFWGLTTSLGVAKGGAYKALRGQKSQLFDANDAAGSEAKAAAVLGGIEASVKTAKKAQTQEAFDQWAALMAQAKLGQHYDKQGHQDGTDMYKADGQAGILRLKMVVGSPGDQPIIKSASMAGTDEELRKMAGVDAMDGRNLGSLRVPKVISGDVGKQEKWWDTGAGIQAHVDVRVNEQGVVWVGADTNRGGRMWLAHRSKGAGTPTMGGDGKIGNAYPDMLDTDEVVYAGAYALIKDMATLTLGKLF